MKIEFSCGHSEDRYIFGNLKEREAKAEWLSQGVCSKCFKEEKQKEFAEKRLEENKKAKELEKEFRLPALEGTEKQVAWATCIRAKEIEKVKKWIETHDDVETLFYLDMFINLCKKQLLASFWIENRETSLFDKWRQEFIEDKYSLI